MIKSLRKKFIMAAMCSIFAVLVVIVGAIQIFSYLKIPREADQLLAILGDHQGEFPRGPAPEIPDSREKSAQTDAFEDSMRKAAGIWSPETPYETRYFSVLLGEEGEILETKTGNIAAIQDETAEAYARTVLEKGGIQGFRGSYRYKVVEDADGTRVIFVDCTREMNSFHSFVITSTAVSLLGLLLVLILVILFSGKIFHPVLESYEKQKRFITDASHELKTPLTIIDANTEVLEMIQGESEWTVSIRKQIKRLTYLVQQMVVLTRMDEGNRTGPMIDFSLSDAVEETAELFAVPSGSRGKSLKLQIEKGIICHGDEEAVRQLTSLLLDNAVKYSDREGNIQVLLQKKGRKSILKVINTVEKIEKGNQDLLFERFYRRDASRSSDTGGSGIGLSIAKSIVEVHNGKIHAYSRNGKSLEITVVL
ncbi:MAG: HAMP domain-containing sensor histidine kinase [Lachnospiraceae bacterium]|nr:HAMP domain-containing sensor histidine kinase [Lachnospiraceae bacterium]